MGGLGRLPGAALPQGQAQRDRPACAHPQRLRGGPRHQHREEGHDRRGRQRCLQKACDGPMNRVLEISNEPLVSVDFRKSDYSSCVDGSLTMVMGDDMVKVVVWYDNEWGYSQRVVDLAELVADKAGTPKSSGDPLEDYCEGNPGAEECIVFDS